MYVGGACSRILRLRIINTNNLLFPQANPRILDESSHLQGQPERVCRVPPDYLGLLWWWCGGILCQTTFVANTHNKVWSPASISSRLMVHRLPRMKMCIVLSRVQNVPRTDLGRIDYSEGGRIRTAFGATNPRSKVGKGVLRGLL